MSALGQKLPRPFQFSVSAFPPKAAAKVAERRVRYGPKAGHYAVQANSTAYSINSSARSSNCGGMVRPSAFAVFRLMTNSNLVGC